jgi:myosin heavy chain 6/7
VVQCQSATSQAEKRQRSFDKVVDEWKRKVSDLQGELDKSQKESRANAAEVYKLRAQIEETNDTIDGLRRENKNLSG